MIVPFYSLKGRDDTHRRIIHSAIDEVISSHNYVGGKFVDRFEERFADYNGSKFAISVGNGFDALRAVLIALDIKKGDEVIVPVHTFPATWTSVLSVGATPVGCDIDLTTGNIDVRSIGNLISKNTKAIICVHMHGTPAYVHQLIDMAKKFNILLIEDCAQAHGAKVDDVKVGNFGTAGIFSFYPTKNLGAMGDGGMIVTHDENLAKTVRSIKDYGRRVSDKQIFERLGFNSRLDALQANILYSMLEYLDNWNSDRRKIALNYLEVIQKLNSLVMVIDTKNIDGSVFHHLVVRVKNRDLFINFMKDRGIETDIHYKFPAHRMSIFPNPQKTVNKYKSADKFCNEIVSLPMHPWLTKESLNYILNTLIEFDKNSIQ